MSNLRSYLAGLALCVVILTCTMKLWRADLSVPFTYGFDSLFYGAVIKGTVENGWYLNNDALGTPNGLRMHYFPIPDAFNLLFIKALALIRADYGWVINVFFLLTFPLTTICSIWAFRQFGVSDVASIVWSLIYTFTPFHFFPGPHHLFVATYFVVPLAATVALWISSGELLGNGAERKFKWWRSRKFIVSVLVSVLVSSIGFGYFAFFSSFFILIGGLLASFSRRSFRYLVPAVVLIAVITFGLFANLTPNFVYLYRHDFIHVAQRSPAEAEEFGLKIAPMLLPIKEHRLGPLARLTERYSNQTPGSKASEMAALGLIATVGFLFLLTWLLFIAPVRPASPNSARSLLNRLSIMNGAGLVLGTVGGFSSLFALIVSPQIRSYHRISIYLAFFSLLAVALILAEIFRRRQQLFPRWIRYAALTLVLIIGVLDQTSESRVPAFAQTAEQFWNDERFVNRIEQGLPPGSQIFQLPHMPFPEAAQVGGMSDYELFRGYLHSKHLRWSYGAIKGSETDTWLRHTGEKPVPDLLEALTAVGFRGIYIDRLGYKDRGADLEDQLRTALRQSPIVSDNQRLAFFDLKEFSDRLVATYAPEEWARKQERLKHPLMVTLEGGCSGFEGTAQNNWRWCSETGELKITNSSTTPRQIELRMALASGHLEPSMMTVSAPDFVEEFPINSDGRVFSKVITLPPGASTIAFHTDAKKVVNPSDQRTLVFRIVNFKWQEL